MMNASAVEDYLQPCNHCVARHVCPAVVKRRTAGCAAALKEAAEIPLEEGYPCPKCGEGMMGRTDNQLACLDCGWTEEDDVPDCPDCNRGANRGQPCPKCWAEINATAESEAVALFSLFPDQEQSERMIGQMNDAKDERAWVKLGKLGGALPVVARSTKHPARLQPSEYNCPEISAALDAVLDAVTYESSHMLGTRLTFKE